MTGRSRRRSALASLMIAAAVSAGIPAGASAHRPVGKFYCYAGGTYYGFLKLKANGRYSFNDRYKGTWTYNARRKRLAFTGYFKKFYGLHKHDKEDNNAVVYVLVKGTRDEGYRCG